MDHDDHDALVEEGHVAQGNRRDGLEVVGGGVQDPKVVVVLCIAALYEVGGDTACRYGQAAAAVEDHVGDVCEVRVRDLVKTRDRDEGDCGTQSHCMAYAHEAWVPRNVHCAEMGEVAQVYFHLRVYDCALVVVYDASDPLHRAQSYLRQSDLHQEVP